MKYLLLLMLLLLPTLVYADWLDDGSCEIDTECTISRMLINETTSEIIPDANCSLYVYDNSNNLLNSYQMDNDSSGYYASAVKINEVGDYPSIMTCNKTGLYDSANVSFNISIGYRNYFYMFLILIPLSLFIFGRKKEEPSLIILAGFLFVIFGIGIYMNLFHGIPSNFVSNTLSLLIIAYGTYFIGRTSVECVGGF